MPAQAVNNSFTAIHLQRSATFSLQAPDNNTVETHLATLNPLLESNCEKDAGVLSKR